MTIETNETGNRLLVAINKWPIAHEDAQIAGPFCGLKGENVEVWLKMDAGGSKNQDRVIHKVSAWCVENQMKLQEKCG